MMIPKISFCTARGVLALSAVLTVLVGGELSAAPPSKSKLAAISSKPTVLASKSRILASRLPLDGNRSVSGLRRTIAALKASAEARREAEERAQEKKSGKKTDKDADKEKDARVTVKAKKGAPENESEEDGTDYLESYLDYLQQRAYPNDTVDWSAYGRAFAQRSRMPATQWGAQARTTGPSKPIAGRFGPAVTPWEFLGPTNLPPPYRQYYGLGNNIGRVNGAAFDPTNSNIYYIATMGGVWKTIDNGTSWTPLSDGWPALQSSSVAVDPTNANIVYAGTGDFDGSFGVYGTGVMKSINGGATWTSLGAAQFGGLAVSAIVVDPETPTTLTVTTGMPFYAYVWRSTDGGANWTAVINNPNYAIWTDLKIGARDVGGNRFMYATGWTNTGHFYRSSDRGATWTEMTPSFLNNVQRGMEMATSPTDPNTVYLCSGQNQRIYKSINAGVSWTDITAGFPAGNGSIGATYNWSQSYYDMSLNCSTQTGPSGPIDVLYVSLIDTAQSPDGGATWRSLGGPTYGVNAIVHNDQHAVAVNPNNANDLLMGCDGGLYHLNYVPSTNAYSWTQLNAHLGNTQFYYAAFHPTDPARMIGGTQDNASPASVGDLNNWINPGAGDGTGCAINPLNPLIQYNSSQYQSLYRTTNEWASGRIGFTPTNGYGSDNVPFVGVMALNPLSPNLLYVGTNYLWRWNETAGSWTARLGSQQLSVSGTIKAIAVSPTDSNRIYTGSNNGELWMTTNAGTSWTQINTGTPTLPNKAITSIKVNPLNPSSVLVSLSGTGTGHVYSCPDTTAGASRVWTDLSGTTGATRLPDIPANVVARDVDYPTTTFYVGTDVGVFSTSDGGANWTNMTAPLGLPNIQVNDLAAVPGTRYLNAATFGRGIWRLRLPDAPVPAETSLAPNFAAPGSSALTLTVNGSGFTVNSVVRWNGVARPTTYLSPTQLQAAIPASDLTTSALIPVTVVTSAPGGGTSVALNFNITPLDVSGSVSIKRGGFRFNRADNTFVQQVTLTNRSASDITGAVSLVLDGLVGTSVNRTGVTGYVAPTGSAYITAAPSGLAVGASVSVILQFTQSGSSSITYTTRALAGNGTP